MTSLRSFFKLSANHTSVSTEIMAGFTTFLTMSYIIFINPQILSSTGMDFGAVFVATCLVTALGSFLIGIMANYPIAIAPGMALNVYFAYVIVQALGYHWQSALGAVFISGIIFFILTITRIRRWIIDAVPHHLNLGITIGIGIFITLLSLKSGGILKADPNTFMTLNNIKSIPALLFFAGFFMIVILEYRRIPGAIIIGILSITLLSILLGISHFHGIFSMPPSIAPSFFQLHLKDLFNMQGFSVIFVFLLVALFDSTGTLMGVLQQDEFINDNNRTERLSQALLAESVATTASALLGTSSTSPFIESAAGIREGGRTGLTAITIAMLFLLALFLSPLAATIPNHAVAPALLYVGMLMAKNVTHLDVEDFTEFVPSILTAFMIPFSFSIADGLGLGLISYVLIKLFCGRSRDLNIMLIALAAVFVLYFCLRL